MTSPTQAIENLMKVALKVQTGDASSADDNSVLFQFIYGVGSSGITPFEKALFQKKAGDQLKLDVSPEKVCETFGHLKPPLPVQSGIMAPFSMQVTVTNVVRAPDREIVKAMAANGNCGDCGCGCGGH